MKLISRFLLLITLIFLLPTSVFAQNSENNDSKSDISIQPARLDILENKSNYEIEISNKSTIEKNFSLTFETLNELKKNIAETYSILPYLTINNKSFKLKGGEVKKLNLTVSSEGLNEKSALYGSIIITTNNNDYAQAVINQGFSIPIYKNKSTLSSADIKINNVNFSQDGFSLDGKTKVNFELANENDSIVKLFGKYEITNSKGEIILLDEFSTKDIVLYPGQSKVIEKSITLPGLADKYSLLISLLTPDGNVYNTAHKELLLINPLSIGLILLIMIIVIFIYLKRKSISKYFKIYLLKSDVVLKRAVIIFVLLSVSLSMFGGVINAQALKGSTYKIPDSDFVSGGSSSGSSYTVKDEAGNAVQGGNMAGTAYSLSNNSSTLLYTYVPVAPTIDNSSGLYYDRLKVTISATGNPTGVDNPTDTDYAVIVQSSSFTNATGLKYITSSNILANTSTTAPYSPADNNDGWRRFNTGSPSWGGSSGILLTGLSPNTNYKFYVKARDRYCNNFVNGSCTVNNTPTSESAIVLAPSAEATPNSNSTTGITTLSFEIAGVSVGGNNTFTTTSSTVNFGNLTTYSASVGSNTVSVTTNASNGYEVRMNVDQKLHSGSSNIEWFTGTNATYSAPETWASPSGNTGGWIGYTTSDTDLSQFSGSKYAPFAVTPSYDIVAKSTTLNYSQQNENITYKLETNARQPAGYYTGMLITYILTGYF